MLSRKWLLALFLSALLLTAYVRAEDDDDEDDEDEEEGENSFVLNLTSKNFDETIKNNKFVLVEFFAPWCGHCKSLAPEYAKAAEALKDNADIKLVAIDATEEGELAEKFGVRGYPTLKWFKDGVPTEYGGGRTADEIVSWINKKTGPPAKDLADKAAVESFQDAHDVVVVGFFAEDSDEKKAFLAHADSDDETEYGIVTDATVATAFDAKSPAIVLFKKFDEKRNNFDGKYEAEAIAEFVSTNALPSVIEFNDENVRKIFGSKIEHKALLFVDTEDSGFDGIKEKYQKVADANRGKLVFAYVNKDKDQVLEYFGVTSEDLPTFFVLRMDEESGDMKKFKNEGTIDDLGDFVTKYLAGDAKPFLKSEPIPEKNDGNVFVVVGKNFKDVVGGDKDVLLEFYAPWCGHCKSLAPKYEKLGKKFASIDSVVIAKADATANDFEGVDISGFPTIKFFPAGETEGIDYDGARSVSGMTKFIKENAKTKFELPEKKKKAKKEEAKEDDSTKEDL